MEKDVKTINLTIKNPSRSGHYVLTVSNLEYSFNKPIFKNVSFQIERGDKVAIIAPNGTGKTTLFNVIAGKLEIQKGSVNLGHNVTTALFDQDQEKVLDPNKTIFEEIIASCPNVPESNIRATLGSLLFSGDDIYKKTKVLSGGERNRVAMAKVVLSNANFYMLDEPTNHLDIESKEIILKALQKYDGTVLFVSHDQDFVARLANKIIELTPEKAYLYEGGFEGYLTIKKTIKNDNAKSNSKPSIEKNQQKNSSPSQDSADVAKKIKSAEQNVNQSEKEIARIMHNMESLEYGTAEYNKEMAKLIDTQKRLDTAMSEWETLLKKSKSE